MKPFNLEEAKAGEPIICRGGTEAKFVAHVPEAEDSYRVIAFIPSLKHCLIYRETGLLADESNGFQEYDLFMLGEPKKLWLNIYDSRDDESVNGCAWGTRDRADKAKDRGRIACIEVTYEKGQGLS